MSAVVFRNLVLYLNEWHATVFIAGPLDKLSVHWMAAVVAKASMLAEPVAEERTSLAVGETGWPRQPRK